MVKGIVIGKTTKRSGPEKVVVIERKKKKKEKIVNDEKTNKDECLD